MSIGDSIRNKSIDVRETISEDYRTGANTALDWVIRMLEVEIAGRPHRTADMTPTQWQDALVIYREYASRLERIQRAVSEERNKK